MRSSFIFAAAFVLVAILGALGGWYLFLRSRTHAIQETDTARGFGIDMPFSFGNAREDSTEGQANGKFGGGGAGYLSSSGLSSIKPGSSSNGGGGLATKPVGAASASASTTTSVFSPPRLLHPGKTPVAGFGFLSRDGTVRLYYVERATGYVFSVNLENGSVVRITNTLRPKIHEALFDARGVIERSIADDGSIETFMGALDITAPTSTVVTLTGDLLAGNISAISILDAARSKIFYLLRSQGGGTQGILAQRDGAKGKVVFSSPLPDWRPYALSDGRLIVAQRAASGVTGFAYDVTKDDTLSVPLVSGAPGLTILPRAWSSALIWSSVGDDGAHLFARTDADTAPVRLSLNTIADKCAWVPAPSDASARKPGVLVAYCAVPKDIPGPHFLEEWYQGVAHPHDTWWKVDVPTGSVTPIYRGGEDFDVRDPALDPSGHVLAFIDGRDDSLWTLTFSR